MSMLLLNLVLQEKEHKEYYNNVISIYYIIIIHVLSYCKGINFHAGFNFAVFVISWAVVYHEI